MGGIRNTARKVGGAIKRGAQKVGKTLYKHKGKIAAAGLMAYGAYGRHIERGHAKDTAKYIHSQNEKRRERGESDRKFIKQAYKRERAVAKNSQPRREDAAWMDKMMST